MKNTSTILCGLILSLSSYAYQNMFISYYSPQDVRDMATYVTNENLAGYILWDVKSDIDPLDAKYGSASLLGALNSPKKTTKGVSVYWTDWSVYAATPYPIPGSTINTVPQTNADLVDKLHSGVTDMVYSFLEAEAKTFTYTDSQGTHTVSNKTPDNIGTLYFADPWSDLNPQDNWCPSQVTCTYTADERGASFSGWTSMGNFEAFANLPASQGLNLHTVISVGGAGHDDTFEDTFGNQQHVNNFVNSAVALMNHYGIQGIDLDYENPNMTYQNSKDFENLVAQLRTSLPANKFIEVTLLANPDFLSGKTTAGGFAPGTLASIAKNVSHINLMTYDFHGAFDYNPSGTGTTGFLTNLYFPTNAPAGYQFSVEAAVQALASTGVSATKIFVGIPAYGRALAGIDAGSNAGLYSPITSAALVPQGDLDAAGCVQNIANPTCSGIFSYQDIVENLLSNGFTATDWSQPDSQGHTAYIGTTAYATAWNPIPDFTLETTDTDSGEGAIGVTISVVNQSGATVFTSDWLNPSPGPGNDKTYNDETNPNTQRIEGQSNLTVQWSSYQGGPSGSCGPFNFTSNYHVMINPTTNACAIVPMSMQTSTHK